MKWSAFRHLCGGVLVVFAMAFAGCERTPAPARVAETFGLTSDPAQLSLKAGARAMLSARASDAAGRPIEKASLLFSVSDPRLLRVTTQGEVTSLGPAGRTSISIVSGSRTLTVPVEIFAGSAHRFETIGPSRPSIIAGTPPKDPVKVRLLDFFDNPIARAPLVFKAAIDPPISLSTTTDANGVAAISLPAITHAGHFALNVHDSGTQPVSLALDMQVAAAAPATLVAVKVPLSGPVLLYPEFELVLQVRDAFGNSVPDVQVRWRTSPGSRSFDPPQSKSGPDGQVRTRWLLTELKGRRATLRAFVVDHEKIGFETWVRLER